jgi:hypothetical protein
MTEILSSFAFELVEILVSLIFALISTLYMVRVILVLLKHDQKVHQ